MLRLLNEENIGFTYAIQYRCATLAKYQLLSKRVCSGSAPENA
jgi:hypothetical protein